jgi:hypothetical protein
MSTRSTRFRAKILADYLNALERLISPLADQDDRLKELRAITERRNLEAHATVF